MPATAPARRVAALVTLPMLLAAAAVVVVTAYRNTTSLGVGLPGLALAVLGAWWVVTEVGIRRLLGWITSPIGLALVALGLWWTLDRPEHLVWRTAVVIGILVATMALARYALTRPVPRAASPAGGPPWRPARPVLICNPKSGGGKVERFALIEQARGLRVEVVLMEPGLDLEELTRDAVARGADCLAMAGGDGSQALVASVAAEHDLPFVCIPAGTRNHFALDLGLDRDDPRSAMAAFRDAVERRVDYATVNERLFVNNVSLGVYATIVQSDEYRDAKTEVTRSMLKELLGRQAEPFDLQYTTPKGREIDGAFLILVSNNPYVLGTRRDAGQRRQLDSGRLGVFAVSTRTGAQAARMVTLATLGLRNLSGYFYEFAPDEFAVRSRSGTAFLGVDGEALESSTPLLFRIHPLGLRMLVPEGNLGIAEQRRARDIRVADVAAVAFGREPRAGVRA